MSDTKKFIKLPESELEVMEAIWALYEEGEKGITATMVVKHFPALNRLKLTTVLTLIGRLAAKGFVTIEKVGRSNCYTPVIDVHEYRKFITGDFVNRVFLDEPMELLLEVIHTSDLTEMDIADLRSALNKK